ncbi:EAL domain-containing protein [Azonexus sp. R2A61]|uniref:EAL domain-containing protein n=1 Tax=Azonexus sp. R2A61 TaxID=2744443 RepID=UPI001F2AD2B1|nr:EAL domain-containing protein [Azonexus sp. R2A61]
MGTSEENLRATSQDGEAIEQENHRTRNFVPTSPRYVVGIGASAGGLEALTALISHLPVDLGICYVVIQHLSPTYRSMMAQLLGRDTEMAVREAEDGGLLEANTIFIAPANHNLTLEGDTFVLIETPPRVAPKPSVNVFLASLAEARGGDAIGVILSGTGSDGAQAIGSIKAAGGFTFAQEPASAKYSGMPQAAIDSGTIDWVLPPDEIARRIAEIARSREHLAPPEDNLGSASTLKKLLAKVRQHTKVDLNGYKENTIWRRIERRMAANRMISLEEYLAHVDAVPDELDLLYKDVLISVTSFFRDTAAFEALGQVLDGVLLEKRPGDELRIWVAGCATGEEAYSIAILLCEHGGPALANLRVQIFATDLDLNAMAIARKGVYSASAIGSLDAELVARYFVPRNDAYEVSKTLREMVVFARQDLVQDPPFLRLDLITCRNVLIYFQSELQARILSVFHYALRPEGLLFLGKSENVYQQESLFGPVHKDARIFRRENVLTRPNLSGGAFVLSPAEKAGAEAEKIIEKSAATLYQEAAARYYQPPGILINGNFDILHLQGNVGDFLNVGDGRPNFDLPHLIRREFASDLQTLVHQAKHKQGTAYGRPRALKLADGKRSVRMVIHVLEPGSAGTPFLVVFESVARNRSTVGTATGEAGTTVRALEDEIVAMREHLQAVIEELETSNEEMQALNEEVQAANEELQSSNEELEASNEELQATNEELTTVNEELQIKSAQLLEFNYDLESIQNCIGFPLISVNRGLEIERFNQLAAALFTLGAPAVGMSLNRIKLPHGMQDFSHLVHQVIIDGQPVEQAISSISRHYALHIAPNVSPRGIRGAIILLIDDTELHTSEQILRTNQQKLMAIMNASPTLSSLKDTAGRYIFINQKFEAHFGIESGSVLGKTDRQVFGGRIADEFRQRDLEVLRNNEAQEIEERVPTVHGERILHSVRFPLHGDDGVVYAVCTQSTDVTERKHAEDQLRLAARVFDHSGEGIVVTDANARILTVNDAFKRVTGYNEREAIGRTPAMLSSGKHSTEFFEEMWKSIASNGWWQGEVWNRRKNGDLYPEWLTINCVKDANDSVVNYVGIFSDISVVKQSQKRIEYLATHDELTGLPNRMLFNDRLKMAISKCERNQMQLAVLFVDVDNFKLINDTMGHDIGDILIKQVAELLKLCIRAGDTVSRFGGDEFTIIFEIESPSEVVVAAQRIVDSLSQPHQLDGKQVFTTASIGISLYPDDGNDCQTLLKNADIAMYRAKERGKNNFQFFTGELRTLSHDRMYLINDLRQALASKAFHLVYQPQLDMQTGQLTGLEALLRWDHAERGLVPPNKFIPLAEEIGLIDAIGEWVLKAVCAQIVAWRQAGLQAPRVAINLSPKQFRKAHVPSLIARTLNEYRLEPCHLKVELTEHALMDDTDYTLQMLSELQQLGVHLSVDDFGTGYSSLSYLKRYPINEIKIDHSFVDGIADDANDRAIARAIIAMADVMGMDVIAEGVETQEQREALLANGCRIAQGYLFARPMPVGTVEKYFSKDFQVALSTG